MERIHVVFKTHFDAGFTGLASEVMEQYATSLLEGVVEACEATAHDPEPERYTWTMPAWPLLRSLENCSPELRRRAEAAIRARQLIWHALPFTTHTEFCGMEEWIRGLSFSRKLSEEYGYRPAEAKMTDVPGHTWILPSLLRKAGVRILHLGCNPASTPPDVPPVFYWEGPDGERLLTIYAKDGYGSEVLPPEDWEHPVWLAMLVTGENTGTQGASAVAEIKEIIEGAGLNAELRVGSLGDFAEDFLASDPELPVVKGDLADSWIHGVGSAPSGASKARSLRSRLSSCEGFLAWREASGGGPLDRPATKPMLDSAYENMLLFGEHTWGMDCKTFLFPRRYDKASFLEDKTSERVELAESSWIEQMDYLHRAEADLGSAMELASPQTEDLDPTQRTLRVYSGLGWRRDGEVVLDEEPPAGMVWFDNDRREAVKRCEADGKTRLKVRDLPPLGVKVLRQRPEVEPLPRPDDSSLRVTSREDGITLENHRTRIVVDRATGWLSEFTDKSLDRDWVDDGSRGSFGHYVYDVYSYDDILRYRRKYNRGDSQWSIDDFGKTGYPESQGRETFVPRVDSVEVERGEGRAAAVCRGGDPESVSRYGNAACMEWRYTLYDDEPYVDVEYELLGKPETPLAESGHVVFPLRAHDPRFRINKMGSVIDPREDIARSANTLLHCCENWVDVCDGRSGLAVIPLDAPLFSIGRNAMWDFEPEYRPSEPTLFFNLYNNWWGTNFPQWVGGDLRFRFRLLPHAGDWREGEVWRTATETMNPPLCFDGGLSESDDCSTFIVNDLDGMAVAAFKPAEDGDGYVMRVRDLLGVARMVPIFLSEAVAEVDLVNLIEYGGGKLEWANRDRRRIHLQTKPFEAHTLKLCTE